MFYGTISSTGTINSNHACSNNFSVQKTGTGTYSIYLNQYLSYRPSLSLTCPGTGGSSVTTATYAWASTSAPFQKVTVYTQSITKNSVDPVDAEFSFMTMCGKTTTFDMKGQSTIDITPSVVSFTNTTVSGGKSTSTKTYVIVLKAALPGGGSVFLDKGTSFVAIGSTLTGRLTTTTVTAPGTTNTWDLSAWTQDEGKGAHGTAWAKDGGGLKSKSLTVDAAVGLVSSQFTFVITGTLQKAAVGVPTYITSDPLGRLSPVPGGGLVLS